MKWKWFKLLFGGILGVNAAMGSAQLMPALAVEQLEISDTAGYAALVDEINAAMKEKYEVPLFLRAYESTSNSGLAARAFSLSPAGSFEDLMANQYKFEGDDAFAGFRERLDRMSVASPRVYLKAVRFDGTNSPGWLLNTLVKTADEAALLEALAVGIFGSESEPKVNVFRVVAGSASFTHLVSLNFDSRAALGAGLDLIADRSWSLAHAEDGTLVCEIVESVVYRELEP